MDSGQEAQNDTFNLKDGKNIYEQNRERIIRYS